MLVCCFVLSVEEKQKVTKVSRHFGCSASVLLKVNEELWQNPRIDGSALHFSDSPQDLGRQTLHQQSFEFQCLQKKPSSELQESKRRE